MIFCSSLDDFYVIYSFPGKICLNVCHDIKDEIPFLTTFAACLKINLYRVWPLLFSVLPQSTKSAEPTVMREAEQNRTLFTITMMH